MIRATLILLLAASLISVPVAAQYRPVQNSGCMMILVRNEPVTPEYLIGNLTAEERITWGPGGSTDDPAPAAGTGQRESLGSTLWEFTGSDAGMRPASLRFESEPLPFTVHIRPDRLIQLDLHLPSGPEAQGCRDAYRISVAVEVFLDDERVSGAISGQLMLTGGSAYVRPPSDPGWATATFRMPSEVLELPKGRTLALVLTLDSVTLAGYYGATWQGFRVGTSGRHQSQLRIPYFTPEEWAFRDPTTAAKMATDNAAPSAGASPLALFALLGLVAVQRPRRRAFALLVVALLGGGCLGARPNDPASAGPGASDGGFAKQDHVAPPGDGRSSSNASGSVSGVVHSDLGEPLPANVILLGTPYFTRASRFGQFSFGNVTPAVYILRLDAQTYRPFETEIEVLGGKITKLDITLLPIDYVGPESGGDRPHRHDSWNGLPSKTVFDGKVPMSCSATSSSYGCDGSARFRLLPKDVTSLDFNTVLPGTYRVDVDVSWTNAAGQDLSRVGLMFSAPNDMKPQLYGSPNQSQLFPRESGKTFRVAADWELGDPGHARFSGWEFHIFADPRTYGGPVQGAQRATWTIQPASYDVKVTIHKGVVPLEPPHPDPWAGNRSLEVARKTVSVGISLCTDLGKPAAPGNQGTQVFRPNRPVPMDATSLRVYLNASNGLGLYTWKLMVHPATAPPPSAMGAYPGYVAAEPKSGAGGDQYFEIPVSGTGDGAYEIVSNWLFAAFPSDPNVFCAASYQSLASAATGPVSLGIVVQAVR